MAYMKHIVLYHWSLCACIVIGVLYVYILAVAWQLVSLDI